MTHPQSEPAAADRGQPAVWILLILRGAPRSWRARADEPGGQANCEAADCIVYAADDGALTLLKFPAAAAAASGIPSIALGSLTYEHFATLLASADVIWSWRTGVGP